MYIKNEIARKYVPIHNAIFSQIIRKSAKSHSVAKKQTLLSHTALLKNYVHI